MASLPLPRRFSYHVAFSYAGEDAGYVKRVTAALSTEIKCFDYGLDEVKAETWGLGLRKHLAHVYKYEALFCVVFVSKSYFTKELTQIEWTVIQGVTKQKPGYVLPVLIDDTKVPELEDVTWIDGTLGSEKVAELITATIRRPPPKRWWFYLTPEVKVAAAALLLALILFARPIVNWIRPSRTSITSFDATAQAITAHLTNRGPKSSTIVGQRLTFGALPIKGPELRLDKSASATIPPGDHDVKLTVLTLEPKCGADGTRLNNAAMESLLANQPVTLEVDIRESDDAPGRPTPRTATVPAVSLKPFVRKWVPGHVPPC